jgi:hypothetical protein
VAGPDIRFAEVAGGFEVHYSERIATDFPDLVDESADWLEDQLGVFNLGQIQYETLVADGALTQEITMGLTVWWRERLDDLQLG